MCDADLSSNPGGEALQGQGLQGGDVGGEGVGDDGQEGGAVTQLGEDLALALPGGKVSGGRISPHLGINSQGQKRLWFKHFEPCCHPDLLVIQYWPPWPYTLHCTVLGHS